MSLIKNKYALGLIAVTVVLIAVIKMFHIGPLEWTIAATLILFIYELLTVWITEKKGNTVSARQSVNLLMGLKVGKILLSLLFLLVYWVLVKIDTQRFVFVFLVLYLIYLAFDTLYLVSREKEAKKKKLLTKE